MARSMVAIFVKNKEYPLRMAGRLVQQLPSHDVWAKQVTVVLVLLLAVTLAQLTWRVMPRGLEGQPMTQLRAPGQQRAVASPSAYSRLADSHLFGTPLTEPSDTINAPETTLNLTLRGIFAVGEERAMAIIAGGDGSELPYHLGDQLPGGAVVHEIDVDRVILDRSGRYETLTLPKESLNSGDEGGASSALGAVNTAPPANFPSKLGDIRRHLMNNPAELMGMNALQPVMENGQLKGYQIRNNRYMPLMRQAGLQPGDVVTRVNGIAVTDPKQAGNVINQLSTATHVELEVQRGGSTSSLSINLRN